MWDPEQYLAFADHRSRPFRDLLARVGAEQPRRVADLGCGAGNLTALLVERWPTATVEALDSSPEMVAEARERGVDAQVGDVVDWQPQPDTDVVVTNAVLQWVPDHPALLRSWAGLLPSGAWLAMQVPGNFAAPSHRAVRGLAREPRWRSRLNGLLLREEDAVLSPAGYAALLAEAGCQVDVWETTYEQQLTGDDPVLDWVTGTALRPIRAALADDDFARFSAELAPVLRSAYPKAADGVTWFPYRRLFAVARIP